MSFHRSRALPPKHTLLACSLEDSFGFFVTAAHHFTLLQACCSYSMVISLGAYHTTLIVSAGQLINRTNDFNGQKYRQILCTDRGTSQGSGKTWQADIGKFKGYLQHRLQDSCKNDHPFVETTQRSSNLSVLKRSRLDTTSSSLVILYTAI